MDGDDHGAIDGGGGFEHEIDDSQLSTLYSDVDDYTDYSETTKQTLEAKQDPSSTKFEPYQGTARSMTSNGKLPESALNVDQETGSFACRLYKHEKLQQEIDSARLNGQSPREAILATLKSMGVKVFIVTIGTGDLADVVASVRRVVNVVAQENRMRPQFNSRVFQRCLLFQDHQGKLFNLVLAPNAVGPAAEFRAGLEKFSGWMAMVGLTILARSLRCASSGKCACSRCMSALLRTILNHFINCHFLPSCSPRHWALATYLSYSHFGFDFDRRDWLLVVEYNHVGTSHSLRFSFQS
jgi:hypothetical protein